jgi:hypothetical protein
VVEGARETWPEKEALRYEAISESFSAIWRREPW